jgi:hypothetical protein
MVSEKHMICGNLGNKEFINWPFSLIHKYSDEILLVACYLWNSSLLPYTSSYTYWYFGSGWPIFKNCHADIVQNSLSYLKKGQVFVCDFTFKKYKMKIIFISYLQIVIGYVSNLVLLLSTEEDFSISILFLKSSPLPQLSPIAILDNENNT